MRLLVSLKASDVEPDAPAFDYDSFRPRIAVRAILFDGEKVALIKVGVHDYYMLPGGGIDAREAGRDSGPEEPKTGLARELMEEIGCTIEIIEEVGSAEVFFDRWLKKQTDYCYVARVVNTTKETARTDFENQEGHEIVWAENLDEAIGLIEQAKPANRDGKLVRARDLLFLKTFDGHP